MTIVYADMVGDLFHYGHVEFLRKAKEFGDILYIGVNGDEVVSNYKRKPIIDLDERVKVIEACKYVDKVIPNSPWYITKEFLDELKVDVVVTVPRTCDVIKMCYEIPQKMGILRFVPYTKGVSTSEIINRILTRKEGFNKKYNC